MNRSYVVSGISVLALCMAGFAALVWADPDSSKQAPKTDGSPNLELPALPTPTERRAPALPFNGPGQALPVIEPVSATDSPVPTKPLPPSARQPLAPPPVPGSAPSASL